MISHVFIHHNFSFLVFLRLIFVNAYINNNCMQQETRARITMKSIV